METKIVNILALLDGITFKQWQIIEEHVSSEFRRIANNNTLTSRESIIKNILQEINL